MNRAHAYCLAFVLILATGLAHATIPANLDALLEPTAAKQIAISPDGEKIAVVYLENGKRVLAIMTLDPMKVTYVLRHNETQEVGEFHWVNDERIVASAWERQGWLDKPALSNYLFAINYDGRRGKTIFGYHIGYDNEATGTPRTGKRQEIQRAHARIISTMASDDRHVLISTYPWRLRHNYYYYEGNTFGEVLKLNVYNGHTRTVMLHPGRGGRAYADRQGNVHFAWGIDSEGETGFFRRNADEWRQMSPTLLGERPLPAGYSADGRSAYLLATGATDTEKLFAMELATGELSVAFSHPAVDITDISWYPGTEQPMAVHLDDGLPTTEFLQQSHPALPLIRGVLKAFAGYRVTLESSSEDGKLLTIAVEGDDLPREFYLVNVETRAVEKIMSSAPGLENIPLVKTEAFDMLSRDGVALQGYLTFPAGSNRQKLPMIVVPHGGPSSRDYWEFSRERQILAAAGYLVMSVNFRGSTGYGSEFQRASDGRWGDRVQEDIADATRWAIGQGHARHLGSTGWGSELRRVSDGHWGYRVQEGIGSTGNDDKFQHVSDEHWGDRVQEDIADATRWAIEQGHADARRICIYGTSLGAHSAMMGAVREPQLYRCAAGFAGVYDPGMLYERGDIAIYRGGKASLRSSVGQEEASLAAGSPDQQASGFGVPVFIAHGGRDLRAPIEHAQALEKALRAENIDVTTLYHPEGGHGYISKDANKALYSGLLEFFARHLHGASPENEGAPAP